MDYRNRLAKLQAAMLEAGLDGLVYGSGANLRYFSGLGVHWTREAEPATPGAVLAATPDGQAKLLLDRAHAVLADQAVPSVPFEVVDSRQELVAALRDMLTGPRIGHGRPAADYLRALLEEARPGAGCLDAEDLTVPIRMIKETGEIARLRRAVELTDLVFAAVAGQVRPGISQRQLEALIAQTGRDLGAEDVSFAPAAKFVRSGTAPSADPFVYPPDAGLTTGSSIAFDFGFVLNGYCSDFGRSLYCGAAPADYAGAYEALQAAQCELISQMGPGRLQLGELFGVIERALDERGYGDRLRARLPEGSVGHQIGVDLHENPWLRRGCEVPLEAGMVMAIEPKVWLPGEYYLRVEDIVLVTATGAESLTQADRRLFELPL